MEASSELVRLLDGVDPFWDTDAGPIFSAEAMRELAAIPTVEDKLLALATDPSEPLARRFAAVEALFQGGWTDWRTGEQGPVIAGVMADAIRADKIHNRWGLPGHYLGRSGEDLLSIKEGVEEALAPLLDDNTRLTIHGGEASTVADTNGYRIADLAGYLLARRHGQQWGEEPDPAVRDRELARMRQERAGG
jgi:hypothetical protein